MFIQLEEKDYQAIAQAIADSAEEKGTAYVDIDGLGFKVDFEKGISGYVEDDYNNGTGAFVCTDAVVRAEVLCDDVEVRYSNSKLEIIAERMLKG